jgi:hypothetical protein
LVPQANPTSATAATSVRRSERVIRTGVIETVMGVSLTAGTP